MFKLVPFALFALSMLANPGVRAGPACARRSGNVQSCMAVCAQKWGWPGNIMGLDPWGPVISPQGSMTPDSALAAACGGSRNNAGSLGGSGGGESSTKSSRTSTVYVTSSPATVATNNYNTSSKYQPTTLVVPTTTSKGPTTTSTTPNSKTTQSSPPSLEAPILNASPPAQKSSSQVIVPVKTTRQNTPTQAPPSSTPPSTTAKQDPPANNNNGGDSDINQYLSLHNTLRSKHGAGGVSWDSNLASKAQQWANHCQFVHSGGSLGAFGENLAAGTGNYGIPDALGAWSSEAPEYNPNSPNPSHFTQMVWKGTTHIGCAVQKCNMLGGLASFYVCEYSPQGNIIGEFAQNVQA